MCGKCSVTLTIISKKLLSVFRKKNILYFQNAIFFSSYYMVCMMICLQLYSQLDLKMLGLHPKYQFPTNFILNLKFDQNLERFFSVIVTRGGTPRVPI